MNTTPSETSPDITNKLSYLLVLAARLHLRKANAILRPLGLTEVQFSILYGLGYLTTQQKGITQQELNKHLELNKSMSSIVIKGLVQKGYVRQQENAQDSRSKLVSLTPKGKQILQQTIPYLQEVEVELIKSKNIDLDALRHALLAILGWPTSK